MQIDPAFQGSIVGANASEDRGPVVDSHGPVPSVGQHPDSQGQCHDPVGVTLYNRQMSLITEARPEIALLRYCSQLSESYPDEDGDTVIHIAAVQNDLHLANLWRTVFRGKFVEQLNEKNLMGQTPLHLAVAINDPHMIDFLMRYGAAVDLQDAKGRNPIHMACQYGDVNTLKILFYHCDLRRENLLPAINTGEFQGGMNSLLYFLHCHNPVSENQFEIIDLLLHRGANPHFIDGGSGKNIAHYIADQNNVALYKYLYERYPCEIDWEAARRDGGHVHLVGDEFIFSKPEELE